MKRIGTVMIGSGFIIVLIFGAGADCSPMRNVICGLLAGCALMLVGKIINERW